MMYDPGPSTSEILNELGELDRQTPAGLTEPRAMLAKDDLTEGLSDDPRHWDSDADDDKLAGGWFPYAPGADPSLPSARCWERNKEERGPVPACSHRRGDALGGRGE